MLNFNAFSESVFLSVLSYVLLAGSYMRFKTVLWTLTALDAKKNRPVLARLLLLLGTLKVGAVYRHMLNYIFHTILYTM